MEGIIKKKPDIGTDEQFYSVYNVGEFTFEIFLNINSSISLKVLPAEEYKNFRVLHGALASVTVDQYRKMDIAQLRLLLVDLSRRIKRGGVYYDLEDANEFHLACVRSWPLYLYNGQGR